MSPRWVRSSRCNDGYCVEVAKVDDQIFVRDSKDAKPQYLRLDGPLWRAFVTDIRAGAYDRR